MRSLVFWWLLATMDREWWASFLDRYGQPFTVAKYQSGDDESRSVLMDAFQLSKKLGGLVVTESTEIEIKQAAASDSGQAFQAFHSICNEEISKLILGQTTSSEAKATGMGSGVANSQDSVRQDIRTFDARRLGATFATQQATQFIFINGQKGAPPIFVWGSVSPEELQALGQFLVAVKNGGLRVADEGIEMLSERAGMPLERDQAAPAPSFGVQAFSAALHGDPVSDSVAREAAAGLSRSLGRHFAPIATILLNSGTREEALRDVQAY